jgi:hypothetical protein
MHCIQNNEFVGAYGKYSIIHPIGYGKILKKIKHGAPVRSAVEQYEIQRIANNFDSSMLYVPKVHEVCGADSYIMEHVPPGGVFIPSSSYKYFPSLIQEFNKFFGFMVYNGYFPYNFSLVYYTEHNKFVLFDVSQFGLVQRGLIKFKHIKYPIHLMVAEINYGLMSFVTSSKTNDEQRVGASEKIEVCEVEF